MIALAVIVAVLALITLLRVGIVVIWDGSLTIKWIIGPFRFVIGSGDGDEPSDPGEKTKQKKKIAKKKNNPWKKVLLTNWQELLELVGKVLRMPRIDPLEIIVTVGGEDPAASALNYGRVWALVGAIVPFLECNFTIGKREIDVRMKQNSGGISVYVKGALTARIGQCIRLALSALILFIQLFNETKQIEKAVQVK